MNEFWLTLLGGVIGIVIGCLILVACHFMFDRWL